MKPEPTSGTTTDICNECGNNLVTVRVRGLCPRCLLFEVVSEAPHSNARAHETSVQELNRLMERYEVTEIIGRGGMGIVYLANDPEKNRNVAIKVIAAGENASDEIIERFRREAVALETLDHPGVISVYDHGELPNDSGWYIVMEHVDGRDLASLIASGNIDSTRALKIISVLCSALDHAHERGVIHRDIKPSNILIGDDGRVKLVDFGLARLFGDAREKLGLTTVTQRFGTPIYMAPEQRKPGTAVDHRADIYSLGVVIYEMLSGEAPLGKFLPLSRCAGTNLGFDKVVNRALSPDPAERFHRAGDIQDGIASLPRNRARRLLLAAVAAVALIVAILSLPGLIHRQPTESPLFSESVQSGVPVRLLDSATALIPPVSDRRERAGSAICLAGDDLVIGVPWGKDSAFQYPGSVHVLPTTGSSTPQILTPSLSKTADGFGFSLVGGNDWFIVGSHGAECAYVFAKHGSQWKETAVLRSPTPLVGENFGWIVARDGGRIAVSQMKSADRCGLVHLFELDSETTEWHHHSILKPAPPAGSISGGFGCSLALHGNTLVVGANAETIGSTTKQGAAYVFLRNDSDGRWTQEAYLQAPQGHDRQLFGTAVALKGQTLAITALRDQTSGSADNGAAYIFSQSTPGSWRFEQQLRPPLPTFRAFFSIAFAGDYLLIGADLSTLNHAGRGAVAVFRHSADQWKIHHVYAEASGSRLSHLGFALAVSDNMVAFGGHCAGDPANETTKIFALPIHDL